MLIIFPRLLSYLLLVFVITFVAIPTISQAAASELLPEASIPATLAIPEKTPPRPTSTELPNPFSNIESWSYPNGLQVFFKSMPKSDIVTYRMTLPTGARQDPPGREGLAHFVEHMLFTGANGRKKAEFEKLIDERGGSNNASTNAYQTDYWLELPAQEWQFGFQWFEELLFDHRFDSELVEEERRAVILERDLQAKTPINYFQDWILQPNWSKSPHEWDTVFGLPSDYRKVIGTWKTVSSINTSDIQSFYDQYYGPQNMTITLIGAFDRERVKTLFDQRFGRKAAFGENTKRLHQTHSNHRYKKIYEFHKRGGHAHTITQYIPNINKNDFMWLLFLRDLLHENLNRELRQKKQAAYGVSVKFNTDQGQAKLHISGNFDPPQEAQSLQFIHTFLAQLTSKDVDPETFEILRRRIIAERKINYQNPWDISNWVKTVFYNREIFSGEYPDIIEFYKQADAQDLSLWMINRIDKNLRVDKTYRPSTMWSLVETCLLILSALLTFSFARSYLIKPLDLRKSLYTRKIL